MENIKVIIKRPDEKIGHETIIHNTLEKFQILVKGYIEVVRISDTAVMIVNEEGKINGLPFNFMYGEFLPDAICGNVIVCGVDGEEFCDIPFDFHKWKQLLEQWGNDLN